MAEAAGWIHSVIPKACLLCGAAAGADGLCAACRASLPAAKGARCPLCALATPAAAPCGQCLRKRPDYDYIIAAMDYAPPADILVTQLKYARNLAAARALAAPLARLLEHEAYPDFVLPMPIAASRLRERGFNQAAEIARHACADFDVRIAHGLAQRLTAGASQTALPWRDRARNVRGAFRCEADLTGKTVAVIDDVLTTGATLNELARTLKRAGAAKVVGWIAARTPANK